MLKAECWSCCCVLRAAACWYLQLCEGHGAGALTEHHWGQLVVGEGQVRCSTDGNQETNYPYPHMVKAVRGKLGCLCSAAQALMKCGKALQAWTTTSCAFLVGWPTTSGELVLCQAVLAAQPQHWTCRCCCAARCCWGADWSCCCAMCCCTCTILLLIRSRPNQHGRGLTTHMDLLGSQSACQMSKAAPSCTTCDDPPACSATSVPTPWKQAGELLLLLLLTPRRTAKPR